MKISARKWSYNVDGHEIVFTYHYSMTMKARVRLFVDGKIISDSGWHYCKNRLTISTNYIFLGLLKKIVACVDVHRSGHEIHIDGVLISSLKYHPLHADKQLPDKNLLWYLGRWGLPAFPTFAFIPIMDDFHYSNFISIYKVLVFGGVGAFLMGTFAYLMAKYSMWRR